MAPIAAPSQTWKAVSANTDVSPPLHVTESSGLKLCIKCFTLRFCFNSFISTVFNLNWSLCIFTFLAFLFSGLAKKSLFQNHGPSVFAVQMNL